MTIKKSDMTQNLYEKLGLSQRECGEMVDTFFSIIKQALADGDDVRLSGFGAFRLKHKKPRNGRNPQTGESLQLAERTVLTFKLSHVFKGQINGESELQEENEGVRKARKGTSSY